jgi:hypothetical protein
MPPDQEADAPPGPPRRRRMTRGQPTLARSRILGRRSPAGVDSLVTWVAVLAGRVVRGISESMHDQRISRGLYCAGTATGVIAGVLRAGQVRT